MLHVSAADVSSRGAPCTFLTSALALVYPPNQESQGALCGFGLSTAPPAPEAYLSPNCRLIRQPRGADEPSP